MPWGWWVVAAVGAVALVAMVVAWNRHDRSIEQRQAMQRFVVEEATAVIVACGVIAAAAVLTAPWNALLIVVVIVAFLVGTVALFSSLRLQFRPRVVALDSTPEDVETMQPQEEGKGDTYNVHAHGDRGTAIGKQENYYAPRAQPRLLFQDISRSAATLTLRVLIDPPNTAVPYVTLFCSAPFALDGLPFVRMNWQEGMTGDGRPFTGFANPVFPFTMEIATAEESPFLGYSFTPVAQ